MHSKSILFICPYPTDTAPSQRFRFEQYFNLLLTRKIQHQQSPFLSKKAWNIIYKDGKSFQKIWYIYWGFIKRFILLFSVRRFNYIFIHREATPLGPPIFEWVVVKILNKKVIYDFDDAIWLNDPDEKGTLLAKLKWKRKVMQICEWSYGISAGNEYLAQFAKQYNDNVVINPTTIDADDLHNPDLIKADLNKSLQERCERGYLSVYENKIMSSLNIHPNILNDEKKASFDKVGLAMTKPVIGWTGSHSTLQYLYPIIPILKQLEENHDFIFLVIANKNPGFSLKSFHYLPWNKQTEIADLTKIDIGIMPLINDEWSEGKCGFKLLQYLALAKPALASPVGMNTTIINHGDNGFLCHTTEDWMHHLELLLKDENMRNTMGKRGREKIIKQYSVESNTYNFLSFFE